MYTKPNITKQISLYNLLVESTNLIYVICVIQYWTFLNFS